MVNSTLNRLTTNLYGHADLAHVTGIAYNYRHEQRNWGCGTCTLYPAFGACGGTQRIYTVDWAQSLE